MVNNSLILVDDILVNKEILTSPFSCNLSECKGACCTLDSAYGAPLLKEEIDEINVNLDSILPYLPIEHKNEIKQNGFFDKKDGELLTKSINNKACVFVYFENGIAKCGIEKAYFDNNSSFRKPISCHLFPIRISNFGGEIMRYEKISECNSAIVKGKELGQTVFSFTSEAIIRKYGEQWFQLLKEELKK